MIFVIYSQFGWPKSFANVYGSWFSKNWAKTKDAHWNCECVMCWFFESPKRSPVSSHVVQTHQGSSCVGATRGKWVGRGGISSSLLSSGQEVRFGTLSNGSWE